MEYNVYPYLAGIRGSGRRMNHNVIHGEGASETSFSSQSSPFYLFLFFSSFIIIII